MVTISRYQVYCTSDGEDVAGTTTTEFLCRDSCAYSAIAKTVTFLINDNTVISFSFDLYTLTEGLCIHCSSDFNN